MNLPKVLMFTNQDVVEFEQSINDWLQERENTIIYKEIQYQPTCPNIANHRIVFTAMIIYWEGETNETRSEN